VLNFVKAVNVLESSRAVIKITHQFDELMMLCDEYCHAQRKLEQAQDAVRSSNVSALHAIP
jgi:ABC-type multidrug transport system ATPase subunit